MPLPPRVPLRTIRRHLFSALVVLLASGSAPHLNATPQAAADSAPSTISPNDLARLRPAVLPDLRAAVALLQNEEHPSAVEVARQFRHCKITTIKLGALGPAFVVEWNPLKAPNASMLNIYQFSHGAFHRLVQDAGFGPIILPGTAPVPDLAFGWSMGVCHASYARYHFQSSLYVVNACDRETEGKEGGCAIIACENKLPTFPSPNPNQ